MLNKLTEISPSHSIHFEPTEIKPQWQFKELPIPPLPPRKVTGNSEGLGGLKNRNFKWKILSLTGISGGVGGYQT